MGTSPVHFNKNLFASIDVSTTGLVPGKHEIVEIAIVPLACDYTPSKHYRLFDLRVKPEAPQDIGKLKGRHSQMVTDACINGIERWAAVDLFRQWFEKLQLIPGKKIVPLGCNYEAFDMLFLIEFFGGIESYQEFFRGDVRDIQRAACFINDLADHRSERIPFAKTDQTYLCCSLEIETPKPHTALFDALACAEVYRRTMQMGQTYRPVATPFFDAKFDLLAEQYHRFRNAGGSLAFKQFREIWERSFGVVV